MALNYLKKTKLHKIAQHLGFDVPSIRRCEYKTGAKSEWLKFYVDYETLVSIWHDVPCRRFGVRTSVFNEEECRYVERSWKVFEFEAYQEIIAALEAMLEAAKKSSEEVTLSFPEASEPAEQPQAVPVKAHDVEMTQEELSFSEAVEATDAELENVIGDLPYYDTSTFFDVPEVYDMGLEEAKAAFEDCKKCLVNSVSLTCPDFLYWTDRFKSLSLHIYLLEQEMCENDKSMNNVMEYPASDRHLFVVENNIVSPTVAGLMSFCSGHVKIQRSIFCTEKSESELLYEGMINDVPDCLFNRIVHVMLPDTDCFVLRVY